MSNPKKVLCPYCGDEMIFQESVTHEAWYLCVTCTSFSPTVKGKNGKDAFQKATAFASRRYKPMQKPFTVEELREMPLFAWVWIEILKPSAFDDFFVEAKSAYYGKHLDYSNGESFCCGYPGMGYAYHYCDYGKTWIALRYEPTEAERAAAGWEGESDA